MLEIKIRSSDGRRKLSFQGLQILWKKERLGSYEKKSSRDFLKKLALRTLTGWMVSIGSIPECISGDEA